MKKILTTVVLTIILALFLAPNTGLAAFCTDYVAPKYKTAVQDLYDAQVIRGYPDGTCKLNNDVTKIEALVMLNRLLQQDPTPPANGTTLFNDVTADTGNAWFTGHLKFGKDNGIAKGAPDGKFYPTKQVNMAETLALVFRGAGIDVQPNQAGKPWFQGYLDVATANGVLADVSCQNPTDNCNRGDVALIYYRMDTYYDDITAYAWSYAAGTTYTEQTPVPTIVATPAPTAAANAGTMSTLEALLRNYETMSPADAATLYKNLNSDDMLWLTIYTNIGSDIFRTACQGDNSLTINWGSYISNCAMEMQSLSDSLAYDWFTMANVKENAHLQRDTILTHFNCQKGEIDAASCSSYYSTLGTYGDMSHDTGMRLIENFGNQCRVDVDPGCYY